jgi:hypothetical protein
MRIIPLAATFAAGAALFATPHRSAADTFGSGANAFDIEFVTIGDPDNSADTSGVPNPAGAVGYVYNIGRHEVSRDMIEKANAEGELGITLFEMTNFGGNAPDQPATGVSQFEAATFINWLNTSSGHSAAYKLDGNNFQPWQPEEAGYDPANPVRNSLAAYFLPSVDEWYKAAYYDPGEGVYFDFPTGSDFAPSPVMSGTTASTAVYARELVAGPAAITQAGGLSPYGTMGQGGNVWEWEEPKLEFVGDRAAYVRGGNWRLESSALASSDRLFVLPTVQAFNIGLRVASIPEPASLLLGVLAALGWLIGAGRNRVA